MNKSVLLILAVFGIICSLLIAFVSLMDHAIIAALGYSMLIGFHVHGVMPWTPDEWMARASRGSMTGFVFWCTVVNVCLSSAIVVLVARHTCKPKTEKTIDQKEL